MKADLSKIKDLPTHPLFKDFPEKLKDPKCFLKIEKAIDKIMFSDHKHSTVKEFVNCKRCQVKFEKKREYIRDQGFKDIQQYQMWKKIQGIIYKKQDFYL
jgi:hypothetical protein